MLDIVIFKKLKYILALYLVCAQNTLCGLNVFAQEALVQSTGVPLDEVLSKSNAQEPNMASVLLSLSIVVLLIILSGWILLKLNKLIPGLAKRNSITDNPNEITLLFTKSLGQNRLLQLVQIENKKYLIGSTPNSMNLIAEVSSTDASNNNESTQNT